MGRRDEVEGVWIGNGGLAVPQPLAIVWVILFGAGAVWSVLDAATGRYPFASIAEGLMMVGVVTIFLPTAAFGRRRSAGIRLMAVVLILLFTPAFAAIAVAGQVEPDWFDPDGDKDQFMRVASPAFAALALGVGIWLFRLSFRKIEPTDYDARHADDS